MSDYDDPTFASPRAPGDMDLNGDLVRTHKELAAGSKCPSCNRRINHPKKPSSPESEVDSFRVPAGEKAASREVEEIAMQHAGISPEAKYARWKYRAALDAYVLQQPPGFLARALDGAS
jgi:hypothetical protein